MTGATGILLVLLSYHVVVYRMTGATGILLFYNYLPDKLLTIKPNKYDISCNDTIIYVTLIFLNSSPVIL